MGQAFGEVWTENFVFFCGGKSHFQELRLDKTGKRGAIAIVYVKMNIVNISIGTIEIRRMMRDFRFQTQEMSGKTLAFPLQYLYKVLHIYDKI